MLVRRLKVAELLVAGRTYDKIRQKLGVGTSTIRDVDGWLTEAAYEYHLIRGYKRRSKKYYEGTTRHYKPIDDLPVELQRTLRGDTRFILFRLLLGDF